MNLDSQARVGNQHMRPLVIDPAAQEAIALVRRHAETPANHYRPDAGQPPPGDDPRFVVRLNTYRVCYSITVVPDGCFRHLSVSVPGDKWPNPAAVFMIASEFGFTGWDQNEMNKPGMGWLLNLEKHCRAVVVAQRIDGGIN